ncbi:unnamed protein product [Leptidea sinapis]|uniref:Exportin-2 n=1 Tax=Leptidea sinapis TaxID=189913 RepID=A0A5E4Q1J2_9NEOP|nr:unnamed protein product [Leptidea sinapis]
MEVTDENLATLANYLQQTLNPDPNIRRPVDMTIRVAAAITFKNYVKRNWYFDEDGNDRIHASDRSTIKLLIVSLMLKSPEAIQRQFRDFHVINGILRTAHSLFKRYRYEFKSQKLWEEIKHVLENIAKPLTDLFVATLDLANTHAGNSQALKVIYSSLVLICKVFYSLNYQDLPEFFEDNMPIWMPNLLNLLQAKVPCLEVNNDDDVPGVMEQLRSEVCECAALYALKYEEEFGPHAGGFVTAVWNVLLSTGPQTKYDALVSNALTFLAKVAEKHTYKSLFEDPATLSSICEKVVIPNMEFRDNPEEYVRRDIEGSDVDTRRRAACDLVRTLAQNYEEKIMAIFGQYVQKYEDSGCTAWRGKDTAMFLVTSLVSRGSTQAAGVTRASPLVELGDFARTHVLPELRKPDVSQLPVLRADAIKYLMTFRSLLPKELLIEAFPLLVQHVSGKGVVCTYGACSVDKLLAGSLLPRPALEAQAAPLLAALFGALDNYSDPAEHNEYVMKAILRTLSCLRESALSYLGEALPKLAGLLAVVTKNPCKPHFNHYLFETLSLSISLVVKANPNAITAFEDALFPIFQEILQNDVQEFMPYVFQMLSLLLELRGTVQAGPDSAYAALLPCLVAPPLWERPANTRPLTAMLGVFQKLIASKTNDHEGFYLVQSLLYKFGNSDMQQYTKQIMTLLFQRLSSSKTTKYVRGLIAFLGFFAAHFGADTLVDIVDSIQPGMFGMYLERVLVPDLQKVSGALERKAAAVGCVKLLADCRHLQQGDLARFYTPLLQHVRHVLGESPGARPAEGQRRAGAQGGRRGLRQAPGGLPTPAAGRPGPLLHPALAGLRSVVNNNLFNGFLILTTVPNCINCFNNCCNSLVLNRFLKSLTTYDYRHLLIFMELNELNTHSKFIFLVVLRYNLLVIMYIVQFCNKLFL